MVEDLLHLTDGIGPRLAGSVEYLEAAEWAATRMLQAGVDSVFLEAFDDPRPGWEVTAQSAEMVRPRYRRLAAHPLPWTPSTPGEVEGRVVALRSADVLGAEELPDLQGAIVLLDAPRFAQPPGRESIDREIEPTALQGIETNPDPNDVRVGYHSRRTLAMHFERRDERMAIVRKRLERLAALGAVAVLTAPSGGFGLVRPDGTGPVSGYEGAPLPILALAAEDASLLQRLFVGGDAPAVRLSVQTESRYVPGAAVSVIGEIRGRVSPNEVVLLLAHLDSHVGSPGATDNAAGVVTLLEVARGLADGPRPERSIRIALLGAEEHGQFLGALAHVDQRGSDVVATLSLDHGAGRIRGIYAMGNPEAASIFRELAAGFGGDQIVTLQMTNQTDHEVFDEAGIPSFALIQDPESYIPWTHHAQFDVPDYVDQTALSENASRLRAWAMAFARTDVVIPHRPYRSSTPRLDGSEEFFLPGYEDAESVYLVGNFNSWAMFDIPLERTEGGWVTRIDLPPGRHLYKFIVDGMWTNDPSTSQDDLVRDGQGHGGLTVRQVDGGAP